MDSLGITYTLQSNASKKLFPANNAAHFIVQLPMELNLPHDYAVALVEIHFSLNFKTRKQERNVSRIRKPRTPFHPFMREQKQRGVSEKFVKERVKQDAAHTFTGSLPKTPSVEEEISDSDSSCSDAMEEERGRLLEIIHQYDKIITEQQQTIVEERQKSQLWQETCSAIIHGNRTIPINVISTGAPRYLYVYCNIVKKRCLGDTYSNFLHVVRVPTPQLGGDTEMDRMHTPMYYRLERSTFDQIEIVLRDESGRKVAFEEGAVVIVTLHFKQV